MANTKEIETPTDELKFGIIEGKKYEFTPKRKKLAEDYPAFIGVALKQGTKFMFQVLKNGQINTAREVDLSKYKIAELTDEEAYRKSFE